MFNIFTRVTLQLYGRIKLLTLLLCSREQLQSIVLSLSVCLFVCLSVHTDISEITRALFTKYVVFVAYDRDSVLHRNILCTSGFVDDFFLVQWVV